MKMDLSPLRDSRDFRLLMASGVVTMFGTFITMVAVPYQMKELTGSYLAVGLVSLAEFVPMVVCGLWGGAIADALDRRKIILLQRAGADVTSGAAAGQRGAARPPGLGAVRGRRAGHGHGLPAAAQPGVADAAGGQARPARRGRGAEQLPLEPRRDRRPRPRRPDRRPVRHRRRLRHRHGSFLLSLVPALADQAPPPARGRRPASLRSLVDGIRYAAGRTDLVGTYLVDIAAMVFAISTALYPVPGRRAGRAGGARPALSACAVGSLMASVTCGWTSARTPAGPGRDRRGDRVGRRGGAGGRDPNVWGIFACLALAGAADMVSGIFRVTMWNQTIPDEFRGRLAGIELLSYTSGPMIGNATGGADGAISAAAGSRSARAACCASARWRAGRAAAEVPQLRRPHRRARHRGTHPPRGARPSLTGPCSYRDGGLCSGFQAGGEDPHGSAF